MATKRYLCFSGYNYYPDGGWEDFQDSFDTSAEAKAWAQEIIEDKAPGCFDWLHVVDTETGKKYHKYNIDSMEA